MLAYVYTGLGKVNVRVHLFRFSVVWLIMCFFTVALNYTRLTYSAPNGVS
jgi:hypothetical protein